MTTQMKIKNDLVPGIFNIMDKFFSEDFSLPYAKQHMPACNILENENDYTLKLVAPGLDKSDFKIEIEKDTLVVSYQKSDEKEEVKENYVRREYSAQNFKRMFTLTDKVNKEGVQASYENGILNVMIPKVAPVPNVVKSVEIK